MRHEKEGTAMNRVSTKKIATWILCALGASVATLASTRSLSAKSSEGAPNVTVSGTVTDGSGHGWPLFAQIHITSAGTDEVAFSDPLTGAYSVDLPGATAYTFAVTAVGPGYAAGGGPVVTAGSPVVANWTLIAGALCNAPGYGPGTYGPPVLAEGFDGGVIPPGWTVENPSGGVSWEVYTGGDPCGLFDGNRTGGSGPYAVVNSDCGFSFDDTYLITPPIDLSSSPNAAIRWANDFISTGFGDVGDVDVSIDGGASWINVWHVPALGLAGPGIVTADMSFAAGHANVKARFHYQMFFGFWWQIDDVAIGPFSCPVLPGGLVVGTVTDANTGDGLNGATVKNLGDGSFTTSLAAPEQGDGFYSLFAAGSGLQDFEASANLHTPLTKSATVTPDATVGLDFSLAAGLLDASPRPLSAIVSPGGTQTLTLEVSNTGTGDGTFVLHEVDIAPSQAPVASRPVRPSRPLDGEGLRQARRRLFNGGSNAWGAPLPNAPLNVPQAANAGDVVGSFPTGLAGGYGLAYDTDADRLWVSNSDAPSAELFGDGLDYQYQPDGTPTGETIDLHGTTSPWQGDGAYNARTGMIWQTEVAFNQFAPPQCLFEIDPIAKLVTGNRICGPWTNFPPIVGLAYDYSSDTYYVGDQVGVITHLNGAGVVLDSGSTGLQISGLAYNPTTRRLFVQTFTNVPFDTYVVDPQNGYLPLSGFNVKSAGVPVLNSRGVSLEADCNGHLWVLHNDDKTVYEFESGETGWCVNEISWLSEDPTSGTIPGVGSPGGAGNTLPVTVTFDSAGLLPGLRLRSLVLTTDTPTPVNPVPVEFTVLFSDVPVDSFAWNYIYGAAGAGIMPGCAPQAPMYSFCPDQIVTRRSMAGFIEGAVHGALTPPPVYRGQFDDVLFGSFNADYIQGLVDDGITAGCSSSPPLYCPDSPVTRAQMAVFVWKGEHGSALPPPCTPPGSFADVPCPDGFAVDYVEGIFAEGITAGCDVGPPALYCPDTGIPNAQMAVFLVKAFGIPFVP